MTEAKQILFTAALGYTKVHCCYYQSLNWVKVLRNPRRPDTVVESFETQISNVYLDLLGFFTSISA